MFSVPLCGFLNIRMKRKSRSQADGLRSEYTFDYSKAVRGKHHRRLLQEGANVEKTRSPKMRQEYDLAGGVRGKYAKRFAQGTNIVILDPDVARIFPDSESVNRNLRALSEVLKRQKVLGIGI